MTTEAKTSPTINAETLKGKLITDILKTYHALPNEFHAHDLSRKVIAIAYRYYKRFPYDDTIMRYFRQLRSDGVINCDCVNRQTSKYVKK